MIKDIRIKRMIAFINLICEVLYESTCPGVRRGMYFL